MKLFFSAGELSGDIHGGQLIAALRQRDPQCQFAFMGGDEMARAAGCQPMLHCREMAFMGFSEVLRNLGKVGRGLKAVKAAIDAFAPDAVVLIDYPSFNLKIAKYAHERGIRVVWYISPKVWAWKRWRVKQLRRYVDQMLVILPFEPAFYSQYGMEAIYVGNPTVEEVEKALAAVPSRDDFYQQHRLRARRQNIALLPGSRRSELKNNLPIMLQAAAQFTQYQILIAAAPNIPQQFYHDIAQRLKDRGIAIPDYKLIPSQTYALLAHAQAALVTSGTATLETAVIGTPQVVCYRANGSRLSYNLMKKILSVRYVSLPNLIADREVIPELLVHQCTAANVAEALRPLVRQGSEPREAQLEGYAEVRQRLGTRLAAPTAAEAILQALQHKTVPAKS